MKKSTIVLFLLLPVFTCTLLSHVKNSDKPQKGEWDFKLKKIWDIKSAAGEVLARPGGLLASGDGNLVVYDRKSSINHLFDGEGRYIKSFGKRGEGPGEIMIQSFFFLLENEIIIPDVGKIHYFSKAGNFIESKMKKPGIAPNLFLKRNEFIQAPKSIFDAVEGKGTIKKINLLTGKERVLAEFAVFKGGAGQGGGHVFDIIVNGLSPLMTIGYGNKRLYYGMSDKYHINIMDLDGKNIGSFSLDRDERKITRARKREHFKNSRLPQEALDQIVKSFPDKLTYFQEIEIHNGLVYIYAAELGRSRKKQDIDIFSTEGKYLYRSCIRFGEGHTMMYSPFGNLRIVNDFLYVVLESESGDVLVRKYKISLPE